MDLYTLLFLPNIIMNEWLEPFRRQLLDLPNPYLALGLFYAIPLATSLLFATLLCRWRLGAGLVVAGLAFNVVQMAYSSDAYFQCGAWGHCGTGTARWFLATTVLPSGAGKAIALARTWLDEHRVAKSPDPVVA